MKPQIAIILSIVLAYTPPPTIGGPKTTIGQGRSAIQIGPSATCDCYVNGIKGTQVEDAKGVKSCKPEC